MKPGAVRFCMGFGLLVFAGWVGQAAAAQTPPPPKPMVIKPWEPPAYPERVSSKTIKPTDKIGGTLEFSASLKMDPQGYKLHNSLSIPEGVVLDLGAGAKLFCLPQVGQKVTEIALDGWVTTHGSATQPAYFGAYSGRVDWHMTGGGIRASYCVFKSIDFQNRGGLMDFKNCLFIDCTIKCDGSAGGQLDLNNCSFTGGAGKTALTVVRSVRGPICRWKSVAIDGYETGLAVDAYDAAMARTVPWDVKEFSLTKITGKAIIDSDPSRLDLGRVYLMGEKDPKVAIEKWVELKTPGNNMTGTPEVNINGLSPTELSQCGTNIKDPSIEPEKKTTNPKHPVAGINDDG